MNPRAHYVICRTDQPDLAFLGELLAEVDSRERKDDHSEWTVLQLYRTDKGKYVCVRERWVAGPDCDWIDTHVADTSDGIVAWLGWSWLTKSLYDRAGIAPRETVE